jgi:hypothetical protein
MVSHALWGVIVLIDGRFEAIGRLLEKGRPRVKTGGLSTPVCRRQA